MQNFREDASSADDFEVEVSALDERDSEPDPAFVAQPLSGSDHPSHARRRHLMIGCCVVLAALLAETK